MNKTFIFAVITALVVTSTAAFTNTALAEKISPSTRTHQSNHTEGKTWSTEEVIVTVVLFLIIGGMMGANDQKGIGKTSYDIAHDKPSAFSIAPVIEQNRIGGKITWRF